LISTVRTGLPRDRNGCHRVQVRLDEGSWKERLVRRRLLNFRSAVPENSRIDSIQESQRQASVARIRKSTDPVVVHGLIGIQHNGITLSCSSI
jgi:hypothetical protein